SQMAEGWARALLGPATDVASAGTAPQGLNPRAVAVMTEVGIDLTSHRSKHVDEVGPEGFDLIVTVCDHAREACPVPPPGVRTLHHSFDDPPALARAARSEEEALAPYRRVRDEIRAFVEQLPERMAS
ncbi:MAG: arsenate reductase ArsC, partial [Gemmatimonadetes bacterium]|nr:arsenate reductase ArsC [Gemmatimonadota bacterium]